MPQFPQELVDAFIERLMIDVEHNTFRMPPLISNTLLSCALVSKSFSAPARKHLFSSISLDPYQPSVQFKVDRILRSPEDITRQIKALGELLANEDSDLRRLITSFRLDVDEVQAIFHDSPAIQTTLRILVSTACNLKNFNLTSALKPTLSWTTIRTEIQELLTTICHSPLIKSISFGHFSDLPVDLILGNPCIESIWLVQTTFSNSPDVITTSSVEVTTPSTIKRLNIAFYLTEFWGHFSTIDRIFSGIEDFGTSIYTETEVGVFKTVLERMPRSLKSLDLVFLGQTFENHIRSIDMHTFRCLRSVLLCLVLCGGWQPTSMTNISPSRWFTFLNEINMPTRIMKIVIVVQLYLTRDEILAFQTLPDFDEESTKVGLSVFNPEEFPAMKKFFFYVNITVREVPDEQITTFNVEETRSNIEEQMLSLLILPEAGRIEPMIVCNLL